MLLPSATIGDLSHEGVANPLRSRKTIEFWADQMETRKQQNPGPFGQQCPVKRSQEAASPRCHCIWKRFRQHGAPLSSPAQWARPTELWGPRNLAKIADTTEEFSMCQNWPAFGRRDNLSAKKSGPAWFRVLEVQTY
ncbi:uncharacterized protein CTRU02_204358 [Colletotrichum truncatum]|uniref:Uncharacterized protein n=1 Tax=Colletotrichum truncatum TaxID=5467 RepID=A0ACC3ZC51_COLTU